MTINKEEIQLIMYRNGWLCDRTHTLEECGVYYEQLSGESCTRERARQILAKTDEKLRMLEEEVFSGLE